MRMPVFCEYHLNNVSNRKLFDVSRLTSGKNRIDTNNTKLLSFEVNTKLQILIKLSFSFCKLNDEFINKTNRVSWHFIWVSVEESVNILAPLNYITRLNTN